MISAMDMVKGVKGTPRHRLQESTAPVQFGVTRLEEVVPACRPEGRRDGVPDNPFSVRSVVLRLQSVRGFSSVAVAELDDK